MILEATIKIFSTKVEIKEQNHLAIKDGGEFEERQYFGEVS